jgi:hypothetical protein
MRSRNSSFEWIKSSSTYPETQHFLLLTLKTPERAWTVVIYFREIEDMQSPVMCFGELSRETGIEGTAVGMLNVEGTGQRRGSGTHGNLGILFYVKSSKCAAEEGAEHYIAVVGSLFGRPRKASGDKIAFSTEQRHGFGRFLFLVTEIGGMVKTCWGSGRSCFHSRVHVPHRLDFDFASAINVIRSLAHLFKTGHKV